MTHKERVAQFNEKLEALSEHYDIPKVSRGHPGPEDELTDGSFDRSDLVNRGGVCVVLLLPYNPVDITETPESLETILNSKHSSDDVRCC